MINKKIIFITLGILAVIGCKSQPEKKQLNLPIAQNPKKSGVVKKDTRNFYKVLKLQVIFFTVSTAGEYFSIRELTIKPNGLTLNNKKILLETDGPVQNAEIKDLDSDGFPELLIYTKSVGSGGYGHVIAYSVSKGEFMNRIYPPDLPIDIKYNGHDEFEIVGNKLVRKFPIYKKGESNCCPTGGTRVIQYILKDFKSIKKFIIGKLEKF